jgi:hypothetical protein
MSFIQILLDPREQEEQISWSWTLGCPIWEEIEMMVEVSNYGGNVPKLIYIWSTQSYL